MVAAMAVEVITYMYAFGFVFAAIIAIVLLIAAARRISHFDRDQTNHLEQ